MAYLNGDDTLMRYKERMGDELGELYNAIRSVAVSLQVKYQKYESLFGSEKSVEALNKFAPGFFCYIQEILFDDLILHISKMFDDHGKGDRKVLCFNCLLEKITEEELKKPLSQILAQCNEKRIFAKTRRNKYIAHNDYKLFLGKKEHDISINFEDVREMMDLAWSIIDRIESFYFNAYTVRHVYPTDLEFERFFKNIRCFNAVGLKKIIEMGNCQNI